MSRKRNERANLLTFTIDVNQDANLELSLDNINPAEFESLVGRLGNPTLGPRIIRAVNRYRKVLEKMIES